MGTPGQVADQINNHVQERATDGLILAVPSGLDDFVDLVVPELQDRGVYRDSYPGTTLRENLGLPAHRSAVEWQDFRNANATSSQSVGQNS